MLKAISTLVNSSSPTNITVSSTSPALTITQTGTGNALLVEDVASDTTPFVIDQNGVVGIGVTTPATTLGITAGIGLVSTTASTPQIIERNKTADATASFFTLQKDRNSAIVQSGDVVGNINFQGYDGAAYLNVASIVAAVDGTPGLNDMPGRLVFSTTADGASALTTRLTIANTGLVTLAATSGLSIGRTAVTAPAATDGNVFSGTYTPTLTNTTNIDASTAFVCQYMRVGNVVTVSGRVDIDPTAAGRIVLGMTLPIASNLAAATQAGGTFSSSGLATVNVGSISGDLTNDRATFDGVVVSIVNTNFHFSFTYLVI
jgi:hypothetical protein